ncbi:hypothetical protein PoB_000248700 [Plakobranchus ocellatus]|uniref:Ig-like domain-containing protein n=1 Tax=Plakobranchus ocellatus TaxID=259542 RepID=A0AAV3Y1H5_9GAST|nr:hypothetical protein PoB_000248700 [Plakobranchus ocellatus]
MELTSNFNPANLTSSFLSVTVRHITTNDAGTYVCTTSSLDKLHLLRKSQVKITIAAQPLISLNVFDLAKTLAQIVQTVNDLQIRLEEAVEKSDKLEKIVADLKLNGRNQTFQTFDCGHCQDNGTTSAPISPKTNATVVNEKFIALEQRVLDLESQILTLQNQKDPIAFGRSDNISLCCTEMEEMCINLINATGKFSCSNAITLEESTARQTLETASTPVSATPSTSQPPKIITQTFQLQQSVDLRDLPHHPVTSNIDLSTLQIPQQVHAVKFHLSACVYEDHRLTEAEKVSVEAAKVAQSAGISSPKTLGLCLGYSEPSSSRSGIVGRSLPNGSSSNHIRCVCRPDAILLQDLNNSKPDLTVPLTWFGNAIDDRDGLDVCIVSSWVDDVSRSHTHLGSMCSGVSVSYLI